MILEPLTHNDLPKINELRPDNWSDLASIHEFYLNNSFCHPMKIVLDNKTVGIGTAICHKNTGWLAHIIVLETYRSKGIGSFLVSSIISLLKKQLSCKTISLIATDLGYTIYNRYGFEKQTEYITLSTENDSPKNNWQSGHIHKFSSKYESQVIQLDKKISGEDRDWILHQFFQDTYVYIQGNNVVSVYFQNLGEGLIIADDEIGGIELIKILIKNKKKIVLPIENVAAQTFLRDQGFIEKNRVKRMILGDKFEWKPQGIYNRIGGYLG